MQIIFTLNHKKVTAEIAADTVLLDLVRSLGCKSVKRGCETGNCGLCTVFLDEKPVLSCSVLAARVNGRSVTTLEGLQEEAAEFGAFIADQGAEQCGFCNPGFIMNALALFREKEYPLRTRSRNISRATSAAAPATRASCGASRISSPGKKQNRRVPNEKRQQSIPQKGCHAACDRQARLHG